MHTIIWAGVALTDAHHAAQSDFAVCVQGDRIVATGPRAEISAAYPGAAIVGSADYLLLPGLVNSHDHGRGLGTFPLGAADDLLELWLLSLYAQPTVDPHLLTLWESIQLLHAGVTTTAHSHNPQGWLTMESEADAVIRAYRSAGVRVAFHPPLVDQNALIYADRAGFLAGLPSTLHDVAQSFFRPNPLSHAEYLALCDRLHTRHHDATGHTVHLQVSPAGGQWCSDELIMAAVAFAQAHGTRVQMHMLETHYQQLYAHRAWGKSFIQHLADIGALGPWLTLAHMIWTEPDDLPLLQAHHVGIAHNPSSNLRLRSGVAPIPEYLAHSLPLGIGMDGQTLDDDQDYLRELRLAWTLANRPGASSPTVTAADILHMGTRGGAAITLGKDVPLGTLAPGALADLVLVDYRAVQHPWGAPTCAPVEMLLRKANRGHVREVMMGGRWVLRDGVTVLVDEAAVAAELAAQYNRYDTATLAARNAAAVALTPYLRRFYASWEREVFQREVFQREVFS